MHKSKINKVYDLKQNRWLNIQTIHILQTWQWVEIKGGDFDSLQMWLYRRKVSGLEENSCFSGTLFYETGDNRWERLGGKLPGLRRSVCGQWAR